MISLQVKGIDKITAKLNEMSDTLITNTSIALQESGILLQEEIEASIDGQRSEHRSVDTGAFLKSINLDLAPNGIAVYSDLDYAKFLEYGTSKIEERRHFRNSLARIKPIITSKFKYALKQTID